MITLTNQYGTFLVIDNADETVKLRINKRNDIIIESRKGTLVISEGAEQEALHKKMYDIVSEKKQNGEK